MNRRAVVVTATAMLVSPLAVEAQQAGKVFRVGVLGVGAPTSCGKACRTWDTSKG